MILDSRTGTKGNFLREDFESHASIQRIRRKEVFQRNSLASVFGLKKKKKKKKENVRRPGLKLKILLAESEKEGRGNTILSHESFDCYSFSTYS